MSWFRYILALAGFVSLLVFIFGKRDLVNKVFITEIDEEDYPKLKIFGIAVSGIAFCVGLFFIIFR